MAEGKNYKDRVAGFKDRVVTEPTKGVIQKVVPVKADTEDEGEIQLGVFIPKTLMRKLKVKAASEDKTVKDIVNEILEQHI
jgi:hypothetical protein